MSFVALQLSVVMVFTIAVDDENNSIADITTVCLGSTNKSRLWKLLKQLNTLGMT